MHETEKWVIDEIERMHSEINRMIRELVSPEQWSAMQQYKWFRPPTDVYETGAHAVVRVEIAGVKTSDLEISFANRVLTVVGRRCDPGKKLAYQQMEIRYGDFRTDVLIPWPVNEDEIEATYEDGFLVILLPKKKVAHKVAISAGVEEA